MSIIKLEKNKNKINDNDNCVNFIKYSENNGGMEPWNFFFI